jgi:phage gpG-like protein
MPVTVLLNAQALASITIQASNDDLKVRANRVLNAARRLVPVDEGRLRASLTVQYATTTDGKPVARIGSNLPYAIFVHEGTGLYGPRQSRIYPKNGKFMVWPMKNNSGVGTRRYSGGKTATHVFARSTKGMKGTPFLLNALDAAK